jgi:hypothetical protein
LTKVGTVEVGSDGSVTVYAPVAQGGARAKPPRSEQARPDEPLSAELTRVVRHLNGLAVAVEALRAKLVERERAGTFAPQKQEHTP